MQNSTNGEEWGGTCGSIENLGEYGRAWMVGECLAVVSNMKGMGKCVGV